MTPAGERDATKPYYPALDGLRGIAVLLVISAHLPFRATVLGWMGVPLFFALSGFLITGILLRSRDRANYFSTFYKRRALRIFPIYYAFIAVSLIAGALYSFPVSGLWAAAIYVQNYRIPGADSHVPPFFGGHTWSLAVEEQFYLLWPLVVRRVPAASLGKLCLALVFGSLAFRFWAHLATQDPAMWILYGWLPSNIDCLAAGALIAVLDAGHRLRREWLAGVAFAGGAALLFLVLHTSWDEWQTSNLWLRPGINVLVNSALAVTCSALVGFCAQTPIRILSMQPLKYVGRISYGLYLFHIPVFWCVERMLPASPIVQSIVKVAATFSVASLSWVLVESPLLARRETARALAPPSEVA